MHLDTSLYHLISQIYEDVNDPELWDNTLRRFVDLASGRCAVLSVIDYDSQSPSVLSVAGPDTASWADNLDLYGALLPLDPGLAYALARPQGGVFRFDDTSPDLTKAPDKWRDFVHHVLGSGNYNSRFSAETDGVSLVLALHTPANQPRLNERQEILHQIVFDHLHYAMRLACRPPSVELAGRALMLVDGTGGILDANPLAEAILCKNDGLTAVQGQLRAADRNADGKLRAMIKSICSDNDEGVLERHCIVNRPSGKRRLILHLTPIQTSNLGISRFDYRCIVEIMGARTRNIATPELLREYFGLTHREAELAALLANSCNNLRSAARELGTSYETARVHAKSIFLKIGVSSQVSLVRKLSQL